MQTTSLKRDRRRGAVLVCLIGMGILAFVVGLRLRTSPRLLQEHEDADTSASSTANRNANDPLGHHARESLINSERKWSLASKLTTTSPPKFEPEAYREYVAQRKLPNSKFPKAYYVAEARNAKWAGDMEGQIQARFDPEVLQKLRVPGLRVEKVNCRTSSCRLEVSWSLDDLTAAHDRPGQPADPLVLLTSTTGPLAALQSRLVPRPGDMVVPFEWNVVRRLDGRFYTGKRQPILQPTWCQLEHRFSDLRNPFPLEGRQLTHLGCQQRAARRNETTIHGFKG
jgi:hypothetical protein